VFLASVRSDVQFCLIFSDPSNVKSLMTKELSACKHFSLCLFCLNDAVSDDLFLSLKKKDESAISRLKRF